MNQQNHRISYNPVVALVPLVLRLENWVFASPAQERLKLIDFGLATRIVGEGWSLFKNMLVVEFGRVHDVDVKIFRMEHADEKSWNIFISSTISGRIRDFASLCLLITY